MNKLDYDRRRESDSFHPCYLGLNTVNRMLERNILLPQEKIDIFFPKTDSKTISSWSEFIPTGYTDSKTKSGSSKYYDNFWIENYSDPKTHIKSLVQYCLGILRLKLNRLLLEWRGCSYRAYYREKALRQPSDSTSCRLLDIARKTKSVRKELLNSIGLPGTIGSACHHSRRLAWHLGSQARQALAASRSLGLAKLNYAVSASGA